MDREINIQKNRISISFYLGNMIIEQHKAIGNKKWEIILKVYKKKLDDGSKRIKNFKFSIVKMKGKLLNCKT